MLQRFLGLDSRRQLIQVGSKRMTVTRVSGRLGNMSIMIVMLDTVSGRSFGIIPSNSGFLVRDQRFPLFCSKNDVEEKKMVATP